jgi:hypothetical protein
MKPSDDKRESSNLPVSVKDVSSLQKKPKNNVLQKVTADAFNIISRTSASEEVIGAWVFDKETVDRLKSLCDEVSLLSRNEGLRNYHKIATRYIEQYYLKANPKEKFLLLNGWKFLRSTHLFFPHGRGNFKRLGIDRDDLLRRFKEFHMVPLRYLNIPELDTGTKYLNCRGMQTTEVADFSKFHDIEELYCNHLGLQKLLVSPKARIDVLDCAGNYLKELVLFPNNIQSELNCSENHLKHLDLSSQPKLRTLYGKDNLLRSVELDKHPIDHSRRDILIELEKNYLCELNLTGYDDIIISCDDDIIRLHLPILKFDEDGERIVKRMKYILNRVTRTMIENEPSYWDVTFVPRQDNA